MPGVEIAGGSYTASASATASAKARPRHAAPWPRRAPGRAAGLRAARRRARRRRPRGLKAKGRGALRPIEGGGAHGPRRRPWVFCLSFGRPSGRRRMGLNTIVAALSPLAAWRGQVSPWTSSCWCSASLRSPACGKSSRRRASPAQGGHHPLLQSLPLCKDAGRPGWWWPYVHPDLRRPDLVHCWVCRLDGHRQGIRQERRLWRGPLAAVVRLLSDPRLWRGAVRGGGC